MALDPLWGLTSTHQTMMIWCMRTTLTLDDDVAVRLERARAHARISLKEAVNRLLRAGLDKMEAPSPPREVYRIRPVSTGAPLVDLTRIGELAALEDEASLRQRRL